MEKLLTEISRFRSWAAETKHVAAEWEFYYPDWDKIYSSLEFAVSDQPPSLVLKYAQELLYILARDNEAEFILEALEEHPEVGISLAQEGLTYPDHEARWQLAVLLGRIRTDRALDLLNQYLNDEHEYVRRRARFAVTGDD